MKKTLLIDDQKFDFEVVRNQRALQVTLEGETFNFEYPLKAHSIYDPRSGKTHLQLPFGSFWVSEEGSREAQNIQEKQEGHCSPMPAKVSRVLARLGQAVKKGEQLVVLEAMKMEYTISAQRDGVVAAIHCVQGEQVEGQALLLELEEGKDV